jgi:hypothetical protein
VAAHGPVELLDALTDAPACGHTVRTRSIHRLRGSHAGEAVGAAMKVERGECGELRNLVSQGALASGALRAGCRQTVQRIHVRRVKSAEEARTWQRTTSLGSVWRT